MKNIIQTLNKNLIEELKKIIIYLKIMIFLMIKEYLQKKNSLQNQILKNYKNYVMIKKLLQSEWLNIINQMKKFNLKNKLKDIK